MKIKKETMKTPQLSTPSSSIPLQPSTLSSSPYPNLLRPTKEETFLAVKLLSQLHGVPERCVTNQPVLDSLVRTILSQNTTDKNSRVAFNQLKKDFPTWKGVLKASDASIMDSIRFGGLAETKTKRVKKILTTILEEHPDECTDDISLDFLRDMSTNDIKNKLSSFNGVGPKTVSCVLMFNLQRDDFPVDTHVWHIAKRLGWVPSGASRETTYEHLNHIITEEHKYALHVLMVEHGKRCRLCSKGGKLQKECDGDCPFKNWSLTVQEFGSTSSSSSSTSLSSSEEEIKGRIEKVTIKEEKMVYETPTAFFRDGKRKDEQDRETNDKKVKRLRHWDIQDSSVVANESKE